MLKLQLDPLQKAILLGLAEHKYYSEIALQLNLPAEVIECKIKSLFCILGFENTNTKLAVSRISGERKN